MSQQDTFNPSLFKAASFDSSPAALATMGGIDIAMLTPDWEFVFPMGPEKIKVSYGGQYVPWTSISQGPSSIYAGRVPSGVSFSVDLLSQWSLAQLYPNFRFLDETSFVQANDPKKGPPDNTTAAPPMVYLKDLKQAIEQNKSLVYVLCWELNIMGVTYFCKTVDGVLGGAYGDIALTVQLEEQRTVLVKQVDNNGKSTGINGIVPNPYTALAAQGSGNPATGTSYQTTANDTLVTIASRTPGVLAPDAYAQAIWSYGDNATVIQAKGGQQDGTLPTGIMIKLPPLAARPTL